MTPKKILDFKTALNKKQGPKFHPFFKIDVDGSELTKLKKAFAQKNNYCTDPIIRPPKTFPEKGGGAYNLHWGGGPFIFFFFTLKKKYVLKNAAEMIR